MKLPFPSLIYGHLVSQGFVINLDEGMSDVNDLFKIAIALMKGNRKVDLPSCEQGMTTGATTQHHTLKPSLMKICRIISGFSVDN